MLFFPFTFQLAYFSKDKIVNFSAHVASLADLMFCSLF